MTSGTFCQSLKEIGVKEVISFCGRKWVRRTHGVESETTRERTDRRATSVDDSKEQRISPESINRGSCVTPMYKHPAKQPTKRNATLAATPLYADPTSL